VREFRLVLRRLFPDLPGVGSKIDVVVTIVKDTGFLRVEVADGVGVVVLEKGFVGTHDFGVFQQALLDAGTQVDETFDAFGGQERVAVDFLCALADAVHPAGALNQPDDRPRQVEVDDHIAVLQVLAF
jgi:hypothetical protein